MSEFETKAIALFEGMEKCLKSLEKEVRWFRERQERVEKEMNRRLFSPPKF